MGTTGPIALVGHPNVGKSALFGALSGEYAAVSNYPGTTVEVLRAAWTAGGRTRELVDTPGMRSLLASTEEETVSRRLLFEESPSVVVQVGDARNLEAHLPLTFQLQEAGLPVVLVLNMMDEAGADGFEVDHTALAGILGIPVVPMTAVAGEGLPEFTAAVAEPAAPGPAAPVVYPAPVEEAVASLERRLPGGLPMAPRGFALLLLQGDAEALAELERLDPALAGGIGGLAAGLEADLGRPPLLLIASARNRHAGRIAARVARRSRNGTVPFRDRLGDALAHPVWGLLAAVAFVYAGLYLVVGKLGAGVIVDFLDHTVFEQVLNPAATRLSAAVPWAPVRDLLTGEYGVVTLGVRYAFAVILPMVGIFFLVFAVIEDSGYLPRLAMLMDGTFKRIGLSGRAVIPVALGFGCDTMATLVTRTLPTRRERVLATLLLALAIPCSAQFGVILGLLQGRPAALAAWGVTVTLAFLLVGFLGARVLPGRGSMFFMEIPPMRLPRLANVWHKTASRVRWYMEEVVPAFLIASLAIWAGRLTGAFDVVLGGLAVPLGWLGLPDSAAPAFLFGFFRRDYGAAGLYDLARHDRLTVAQLATAAVTLTLFLPCIAQLLVMGRERGWRTAGWITAFVSVVALASGWAVSRAFALMEALPW